jgi:protein SCO1/2
MRAPPPDRAARASDDARPRLWHSPYFWAALAGLILVPLSRPFLHFEPTPPAVGASLPAVELVDQHGAVLAISPSPGRVLVLGFFFTRCTTLCPPLGDGLAALAGRYEEAGIDGVTVAAVSVDPQHDGPAELQAWAARHGADGGRVRLLGGEARAVRELGQSLGLEPRKPMALSGTGETSVDIAHFDRLALIDGDGRLRGLYRSDERGRDEIFHRSLHVLGE